MTFNYFFFDTDAGFILEVLPLALIVAAIYGIIRYNKDRETPFIRKILSCAFVCYMTGLVSLVLLLKPISALWYLIIHGYSGGFDIRFFEWTFNFVPTIFHRLTGEQVGNIFMFLPFGFLFPFFSKNAGIKKTVLYGLVCSVCIEILQPIFGRAFDINDIILNTFGVFISALIFQLVKKLFKKKKRRADE